MHITQSKRLNLRSVFNRAWSLVEGHTLSDSVTWQRVPRSKSTSLKLRQSSTLFTLFGRWSRDDCNNASYIVTLYLLYLLIYKLLKCINLTSVTWVGRHGRWLLCPAESTGSRCRLAYARQLRHPTRDRPWTLACLTPVTWRHMSRGRSVQGRGQGHVAGWSRDRPRVDLRRWRCCQKESGIETRGCGRSCRVPTSV